jgi:hypothetical protein
MNSTREALYDVELRAELLKRRASNQKTGVEEWAQRRSTRWKQKSHEEWRTPLRRSQQPKSYAVMKSKTQFEERREKSRRLNSPGGPIDELPSNRPMRDLESEEDRQ